MEAELWVEDVRLLCPRSGRTADLSLVADGGGVLEVIDCSEWCGDHGCDRDCVRILNEEQ